MPLSSGAMVSELVDLFQIRIAALITNERVTVFFNRSSSSTLNVPTIAFAFTLRFVVKMRMYFDSGFGARGLGAPAAIATARVARYALIANRSHAEQSAFRAVFDGARARHAANDWPEALPWFDLLEQVFRAVPIGVKGAFDYGLKSIAKAMHAAGLIGIRWNTTDGLAAMRIVRAAQDWKASRERVGSGSRSTTRPTAASSQRSSTTSVR